MSDQELFDLFTGYGYQVRFIENMDDIDSDMAVSMDWAYQQIRTIQQAARTGKPIFQPRWPLLIMKTPKGFSGIKTLNGQQIEGTWRAHQIPVQDPIHNESEFSAVKQWLESYKIHELIDPKTGVIHADLLKTVPHDRRRMGDNPKSMPEFVPLELPPITDYACARACFDKGGVAESITQTLGKYLSGVIKRNPHRFRIFSPDELTSNKIDAVLKVTNRNFQWDKETANKGGQVLEMLSEHTCEGWMQGYCLTGRFAMFPSYETFLGIVTTMMIQYSKFIKLASETKWRSDTPSINYIETSTLWRQEHNGYSHQDPMFINNLINMKSKLIHIYLPPDVNSSLCAVEACLNRKRGVNLIISTKKEMPLWFNMEHTRKHFAAGASVWKQYSTFDGLNPDVVIVGCGNETHVEAVAAVGLLKRDVPNLRVRFINVVDLMVLDIEAESGLTDDTFENLFTSDKPVIFNFHGYPSAVRSLLFGRNHIKRFKVLGYIEEGTTTTPFKMLTANKVSRFHVAIEALREGAKSNPQVALDAHLAIAQYEGHLKEHDRYIVEYGKDPEYLADIFPKSA